MARLRMFSTMLLITALCAAGFSASARPQTTAPPDRRVAVTIDDLPANMFRGELSDWQDMTATLLDGLVRNEVPAIGFVNEEKLYVGGAAEPDPADLHRAPVPHHRLHPQQDGSGGLRGPDDGAGRAGGAAVVGPDHRQRVPRAPRARSRGSGVRLYPS